MIDPAPRNARVVEEAADPETGVILLDVVLGYGSNPDPAGELARAVASARAAAADARVRPPVFVASVCGAEGQIPSAFPNSAPFWNARTCACAKATLRPSCSPC